MNLNNIAVVIVDMQFFFFEWILKEERVGLLKAQIEVIRLCRKNGIPLIVLEYVGFGDTIIELRQEIMLSDKLIFVEKEWPDGFLMSKLDDELISLGARNLFFMGVNADGCLKKTAEIGIEKKYKVFTSEDVIAQKFGGDKNIKWYQENSLLIDFELLLSRHSNT